MKKIISLLLLAIFISTNFSFAETCLDNSKCEGDTKCGVCEQINDQPNLAGSSHRECAACISTSDTTAQNASNAAGDALADAAKNINNPETCETVMGITCCGDQLINGQCKFNVYDTLGIRKSVRNPGDATSVGLFAQDIILSATFFIGTIVTVALVVSGIMYILAASSGKDPANAKNGIIGSLVGLLLVVSSYVIIRLVQYIAKGF